MLADEPVSSLPVRTLVKLIAPVVALFSGEFSCDSVYLLLQARDHNLLPRGGGGGNVDPPADR